MKRNIGLKWVNWFCKMQDNEFLLEETEVFYAVFHIRKVRNVNFTVISEHIISC